MDRTIPMKRNIFRPGRDQGVDMFTGDTRVERRGDKGGGWFGA